MMTSSLSFPNMFDVSRNKVGVLEDSESIVNRVRLMILTEQGELYNSPEFGVGLKRHLWQYNNDNQVAIVRDRIKAALNTYEPCVDSEKTSFVKGLLFTGTPDSNIANDQLDMTIGLSTIYGDSVEVQIDEQ